MLPCIVKDILETPFLRIRYLVLCFLVACEEISYRTAAPEVLDEISTVQVNPYVYVEKMHLNNEATALLVEKMQLNSETTALLLEKMQLNNEATALRLVDVARGCS